MPTPQEAALAAFFKSPGVRNSTANASGVNFTPPLAPEEDMVPGADSAEVRALQQSPEYGSYSRQQIREGGLAKVRGLLKMEAIKNQAALEREVVPAHIKGQYDVQASQNNAEASMNRVMAQQQGQDARTEATVAGALQRANVGANATLGANQVRQDQTTGRQAGKIISQRRAALEKEVQAGEPNAIMKFMGKQNPNAKRLAQFDAARDAAEEIARDHGDKSAEEALAEMGVNVPPAALAQIQDFLLLLRGHP